MNQQITREILWNVPVAFRILLYAMLVAGGWCCATWRAAQRYSRAWSWIHYAFCVGLLGLFIGTTIIFFNFFNDGIAEAAGVFGFPYYLVGMTEIL